MFNLISNLIGLAVAVIGAFFVTRKLVMMWTGSTKEEATKKIQAFVSQKEVYHLSNDQMLITDLWNAVSDIVGDERYAEIRRLSRNSRILEVGYASGLPYIAITTVSVDANEQVRVEHILCDIISTYLSIHGLCNTVLSDWKENYNLNLPCLMLRYAETEEEAKILNAVLSMERQQITQKYQPVLDEDLEFCEADESDTTGL